jgi:hypothetical protein
MADHTTPRADVAPVLPIAAGVLRVVMVGLVVLGLATLPLAGWLVVADLSDHSDEWDGLAAFFGAVLGGAGLLLAATGSLVVRLLRRHPRVAGAVAAALGAMVLLTGLRQGAAFGVGSLAELSLLLVGLLVAVPGALVLVAARTASTRPGSPGRTLD